jgi:hypothetical protein
MREILGDTNLTVRANRHGVGAFRQEEERFRQGKRRGAGATSLRERELCCAREQMWEKQVESSGWEN